MTEQELIDIINALIDADVKTQWPNLNARDIACRAIDRCGEGVFTMEAVTDLVEQILDIWSRPCPGTRPACEK